MIPGVIQINAKQFKGAQIIRIGTVPAALSGDLVREVIAACRQAGASAELMLFSDTGNSGALQILLILRAIAPHPVAVAARLRDLTASIARNLEQQAFQCSTFVTQPDAEAHLPWTSPQRQTCICFYPPESDPAKTSWYLPGNYRTPGLTPVDFAAFAPVMTAFPGSILSLQVNTTSVYPYELQRIKQQIKNFEALSDDPKARTAADIYKYYESLSSDSKGVFEVNFFAFGSPAFSNELITKASLCGLKANRFPFALPPARHYFYRGNETMSSANFIYGHEQVYGRKLPKAYFRLTHLTSLDDLAESFPLPRDLESISGLRINRIITSAEPLPDILTRPDGIYLGQYYKSNQSVFLPVTDLTRHGMFTGKPGSGKTVFALGMLWQLHRHKNHYPFLAFEPAKKEYRSLLGPIPDLQVYTPGRQDIAPLQLNIFLPPKGVRLEQYLPVVENIFTLAVTMTHPLDVIFPQVIRQCYSRYGWRLDSTRDDKGVRIFGLHEFICEFRRYAKEHYGRSPEDFHNIETGGIVRLLAMRNPTFDTNESIDIESLLAKPTVIELDALSNNRQRSIVSGSLRSQIMLFLQQRDTSEETLKNVILIDEAHLLLDQNDTAQTGSAHSQSMVLEMLQNMTVILRSYGTALLFGDQSAKRLTSTILGNVNLKMMFRTDSTGDRQILADQALMTEEMSESIVSLPPGQAYMYCDRLREPVYITVPHYRQYLKLGITLPDEQVRDHMQIKLKPPFYQCRSCKGCKKECNIKVRSDARFIAEQLVMHPDLTEVLSDPYGRGQEAVILRFLKQDLPEETEAVLKKFRMTAADLPRLTDCVRIQLIRELLLNPECILSEEQMMSQE